MSEYCSSQSVSLRLLMYICELSGFVPRTKDDVVVIYLFVFSVFFSGTFLVF